MISLLRSAIVLFLLLTAITGIAYPFAVTGVAQLAFAHAANGSLIVRVGKPVGSELIGQAFDSPKYFWGRPSSTLPMPYNADASGGSDLGPSNPALIDAVKQRIEALRAANPDAAGPIPAELAMASASGLDPDISPQAARWQAPRIAKERGMSPPQVELLIQAHEQGPMLGLFGEPRVNVLALNLALDDATHGMGDNPRR